MIKMLDSYSDNGVMAAIVRYSITLLKTYLLLM